MAPGAAAGDEAKHNFTNLIPRGAPTGTVTLVPVLWIATLQVPGTDSLQVPEPPKTN